MQFETNSKAPVAVVGSDQAASSSAAEMARKELVKMIRDSVITLCLGGLMDGSNIERVEGLIGITLKSHEVFLVNIGENLGHAAAGVSPIKDCARPLPVADNRIDLNSELHLPASDAVKDICSELFDSEDQVEVTKSVLPESSTHEGQIANVTEIYCKNTFRQSSNENSDESTASALAHVMSIAKQQQQPVAMAQRHSMDNHGLSTYGSVNSSDPGSMFIKQEPLISDEELSGNEDLNDSADLDFMTDGGPAFPEFAYPQSTSSIASSSAVMSPLDSMSRMLSQQRAGPTWLHNSGYAPRGSQCFGSSDVDMPSPVADHTTRSVFPEVVNWNSCKVEPCERLVQADSSKSAPCRAAIAAESDNSLHHSGADSESRPFACRLCDASFSKKFCLANHIVTIHQVGGKYVCSICGKQFLQRLRYTTHVDRHANVRRHICTTCGKAFTYKYSLWSHAKKCSSSSGASADMVAIAPLNAMSAAGFSNNLKTARDAEFANPAAVPVDFSGLSNDARQSMSSDENGHSVVTGGCANKVKSA